MSRKAIEMFCSNFKNGKSMGDGGLSRLHQPESGRSGDLSFGKLRIAAVILTAAVVLLNLGTVGCKYSHAAVPNIVTEVLVAQPIERDVPLNREWVATLDGYVNAEIRSQVSGYIISQNYKEGAAVGKDQVLFEIDPRPFQADLDHAKAQLAQAEAELGRTTLDVQRDTPLAEQKAIAQAQLDTEIQAKLAAQAAVQSGKAAVERAQLNLGWTKVTSLVDGVAGIAEVQIGNLVGPNVRLTSVSQVNPIKVYFPVSEQEYLRAQHVTSSGQDINLLESSPDLILADGTVYPYKGKILLTDRQVDVNTGTIRVVAAFPNSGNKLRPGQYGRVRIQTSIQQHAILVPQSAVKELQGGYQVALLGPDNKAIIRPVKAGQKVGTMWVIDDGLKPGEQVIVEGIEKVKDGTPVVPKPANTQVEGR